MAKINEQHHHCKKMNIDSKIPIRSAKERSKKGQNRHKVNLTRKKIEVDRMIKRFFRDPRQEKSRQTCRQKGSRRRWSKGSTGWRKPKCG